MHWLGWRLHFERTAGRPLPDIDAVLSDVPARVRDDLTSTLARFARGESGGRQLTRQLDVLAIDGLDEDYRRAAHLFIAEENRHAEILMRLVRALGGEVIEREERGNLAQRLFAFGRHLVGVRMKILVLLIAEVVAVALYGLLVEALPGGTTRTVLEEIVADEYAHLKFHGAFFRTCTPSGWRHALFLAMFLAVGLAATLVVAIDHRATIRAFRVRPSSLAARIVKMLGEAWAESTPTFRAPSSNAYAGGVTA